MINRIRNILHTHTQASLTSFFCWLFTLTSQRLFVFEDQNSDVNDEDSEEEQDHDVDSDVERPTPTRAHPAQRPRRSVLGCQARWC